MAERAGLSLIDNAQLECLVGGASKSPRLRTHLLLHSAANDQVQRLLIGTQPGTYVRPHRHSEQWEMLVLLSGSMDVLCFSDQSQLLQRERMHIRSPVVQIAPGVVHGCLIDAADTVVLEVKPGPYRPNEFVDWAPEEGGDAAEQFLNWAKTAAVGCAWAVQ